MPYTQEQIEQAKEWLESGDEYDKSLANIILAALEAAQKERDEALDAMHIINQGTHNAVEAVKLYSELLDKQTAYAAKLEKAGDGIRNYKPDSNPLQAETDIEELFDAWDAARKAKP